MRLSRTRGELPWKRERRAVAIERVFPGVVGNSDGADDRAVEPTDDERRRASSVQGRPLQAQVAGEPERDDEQATLARVANRRRLRTRVPSSADSRH